MDEAKLKYVREVIQETQEEIASLDREMEQLPVECLGEAGQIRQAFCKRLARWQKELSRLTREKENQA